MSLEFKSEVWIKGINFWATTILTVVTAAGMNAVTRGKREAAKRKKDEIKHLGINPPTPGCDLVILLFGSCRLLFLFSPMGLLCGAYQISLVLHGSGPFVFFVYYLLCCILGTSLKSVQFHSHLCLIYYLACSLSFDFLSFFFFLGDTNAFITEISFSLWTYLHPQPNSALCQRMVTLSLGEVEPRSILTLLSLHFIAAGRILSWSPRLLPPSVHARYDPSLWWGQDLWI